MFERKLISYLKKQRGLLVVYLFGSRARGQQHPSSDYDFAVLLDSCLNEAEQNEKQVSLSTEIGAIVRSTKVDILILNSAPSRFIHQVIKYGKLLYEKDPFTRACFEARAHSFYLDEQYFYNIEYKYLVNRIKNGQYAKEVTSVGG
jgi:predicted nucleotidyltransferase